MEKKTCNFILDDDFVECKRKLDILFILFNNDDSYKSDYNGSKTGYNHKLH